MVAGICGSLVVSAPSLQAQRFPGGTSFVAEPPVRLGAAPDASHVSLKPLTEIFEVTRLAEPGQAVRIPNDDYTAVRNLETSIFSSEQQISTEDQIRVANAPLAPQPQAMLSAAQ